MYLKTSQENIISAVHVEGKGRETSAAPIKDMLMTVNETFTVLYIIG